MVVETFIYSNDEDRRRPSMRISLFGLGEQAKTLMGSYVFEAFFFLSFFITRSLGGHNLLNFDLI